MSSVFTTTTTTPTTTPLVSPSTTNIVNDNIITPVESVHSHSHQHQHQHQNSSTSPVFVRTVIKRSGKEVDVQFDKITKRIQSLVENLHVEPVLVTRSVINCMVDKMHVSEIDELAAQCSAFMIVNHIDYLTLAGRLLISNLHRETLSSFSETMEQIHYQTMTPPAIKDDQDHFLSAQYMAVVRKYAKLLDANINHQADYSLDYFGVNTMFKYLIGVSSVRRVQKEDNPDEWENKIDTRIVERPQYTWMRVAVFLNMNDIHNALHTYKSMSSKQYIHASPTLFNAGKAKGQLASCFLLQIFDDSIEGIYETLKQCALISKDAGGIGLSLHRVRGANSLIHGSNGLADGLIPMTRVYNTTARYVNQGGVRKGAFAMYLEPWHIDIYDFLDLKKNRGNEERRSRDMFYGLWVPDLFMKRVENDEYWTLFSPDDAPQLCDLYGEAFDEHYVQMEVKDKGRKRVKARHLWTAILNSQIETGVPYILYKDACNRKSNQKNLGTIHSSNLCAEIVQYTSAEEISVCNLASLCLPSFVENGEFRHDKLFDTTTLAIANLNRVINLNHYPVKQAETSNLRHRPVAVGVQGLADVFLSMMIAFESPKAIQLNKEIFETIYFAALTASKEWAKQHGPYASFQGSPASQGQLQFDLWGVEPSDRYNWKALKQEIQQHGLANSLVVALMPTASTSQIMGFNEAFEPYTRNIYTRRTLAGEFLIVNRWLAKWLIEKQLWNRNIIDQIICNRGSVQLIDEIPDHIKEVFKTASEIKTSSILRMSADRGPFVCQSQSMNLFIDQPNVTLLHSIHLHAWKLGLKTGMYYLRSQALTEALQFTVDPTVAELVKRKQVEAAENKRNLLNQSQQPQPQQSQTQLQPTTEPSRGLEPFSISTPEPTASAKLLQTIRASRMACQSSEACTSCGS